MLFTFKDLPRGCKAHDDEKHIWDCAFFDSEWTWKKRAKVYCRTTAKKDLEQTTTWWFQPIFNLDSDSLHKNWKDQVKNQISLKQADGVSLFWHFFSNNSVETTLQRTPLCHFTLYFGEFSAGLIQPSTISKWKTSKNMRQVGYCSQNQSCFVIGGLSSQQMQSAVTWCFALFVPSFSCHALLSGPGGEGMTM